MVYHSVLSVCLYILSLFLSVCRSEPSVSLICLSHWSVWSFFLSGLSFCLVFVGCFVCISVSFSVYLSVSLSVSISKKFVSIWLVGHLPFSLVFLSGFSVCIVFLYRVSISQFNLSFCQSVYLSDLSICLFVYLLGPWVCLSVWSLCLSCLTV